MRNFNDLGRVIEDHEIIVDIVSQWPRETDNQLVFTMRRDKYVLFKNPQVIYSAIKDNNFCNDFI